MKQYLQFYINGQWIDPAESKTLEVINPATEKPFAQISLGTTADVDKAAAAAHEEIFGPVLCILAYHSEEEAIEIANDTVYGLAGYVSSGDMDHAIEVARQIRAGQVAINYVGGTTNTPFGGYKQSGNGREKSIWGLRQFTELKAITGS